MGKGTFGSNSSVGNGVEILQHPKRLYSVFGEKKRRERQPILTKPGGPSWRNLYNARRNEWLREGEVRVLEKGWGGRFLRQNGGEGRTQTMDHPGRGSGGYDTTPPPPKKALRKNRVPPSFAIGGGRLTNTSRKRGKIDGRHHEGKEKGRGRSHPISSIICRKKSP